MSFEQRLAGLRQEYAGIPLTEDVAESDPRVQFRIWMDQAIAADVDLSNAMSLATVEAGQPSLRIVLLKKFDDNGLVFYTNENSRKAAELASNPNAAALFWWPPLSRQLSIQGKVVKISPAESDSYFATRPRASNLSAIASPQSRVVASRAELEQRVAEVAASYQDKPLKRPQDWGGYRLIPREFEFWQGRPDRLHDRLRYRLDNDHTWIQERLAP